ncbi:MAG: hypothetical protein Q8M15_09235 [Bacteroidota bacterium]|nr:hypothetical protein [Bacteroidota bacterium]
MKYFFLFILFYSLHITAQAQKIDFCRMLKAVQSNYCQGLELYSDSCVAQKIRRNQAIEDNYNALLDITNKTGFPNRQNHPKDSCVHDFTLVTLIHMVQSKPELIFNESIITLFEEEIKKENLKKVILLSMFSVYSRNSYPKEKDRAMVELAIKKWKLEREMNQGIEIEYYPEL